MKVLDLGCHDGFVGAWLQDQMGDDIELHGVELHRGAAAKARERGYVEVYETTAEDTCANTELARDFDAVVIFELIEHVTDVDALLTGAERMLKPDGRIYISTPDGTFGEGSNPHHLRCYRAIDLVELVRRRGHIENMAVGRDGLSIIAYTPAAPARNVLGEVAIYCGPGWERWSPMDIETKGLGGSETAATRLADSLSKFGYTVTVYGDVETCAFRQVTFRPEATFDPTVERAAVISSRLPELFDVPMNARARLLWMHDTDAGPRLTAERASAIDRVMALSLWHQDHLLKLYPFLADKIDLTANGIQPEYFDGPRLDRAKRVIYSSSPDRGLDLLLEVWPQVRKQVPDAELRYCYSSVYDAVAEQNPAIAEFRDHVRALAMQPGVENLGSLTQPGLALEMRKSKVWVAPSYSTPAGQPFNETYCIGALEAQAAGCFRVAAHWGALGERGIEYPVETNGGNRPDRDMMVEGIVKGLNAKRQPGKHRAAIEQTWDVVAQDFHEAIQGR